MTVMAIFQDVDKCMRCNGCVISCKRTWQMKALNWGVHKTAPDQRVIIKSQKRVDMGPFMRYSCWHCTNPPCVKRCPFGAIKKDADSGAVYIDPTLCNPSRCSRQCQIDCGRGGYPKIGNGSNQYPGDKAWKCTLCFGRAGAIDTLRPAVKAEYKAKYGNPLPTKYANLPGAPVGTEPALDHEPSCVYTCPAKAMHWDTKERVYNHIKTGGYISAQGDGSVYWASRKYLLIAPKADPLVEDHVTPLVSTVLSSPFAKAALVPAALGAGLYALIARRQRLAESMEEV
jgi:Fe-S-cluster-containing dehydrogenase component